MGRIILFCCLTFFTSFGFAKDQEVENIYKDIRDTLGLVPTFLKNYPSYGLVGAWESMKGLELNPDTSLPPKYKELILISVASQIPCRYCTYFHSEMAKINKATDMEINEAISLSGITRKWSAFLNGVQINVGEFRSEIDHALMFKNNQRNLQAMEAIPTPEEMKLETPQDVFRDVKTQFGLVPNFITQYPKGSLVGAWKELKGLALNPYTTIPQKYKELIGVAVSSQIPCNFCVYYHTLAAMNAGATKEDLEEAVALAGSIRAWSGVLNGMMLSENDFKIEVNQMIKYIKFKSQKKVGVLKSTGRSTLE
jgi:AhpD family alkylhydroperoxidase